MRKHAQVQHAAPGTDVKHVFAHKMSAYPHLSEVGCVSTPRYSPPPYQPPTTTQPATLTATSQQGGSQTYPASGTNVKQATAHVMYAYCSSPEVACGSTILSLPMSGLCAVF